MASKLIEDTAQKILGGSVGIMPTDTVFGIVAKASNRYAVEKVYPLKQRPSDKAFIVLISNYDQLYSLDIKLNQDQLKLVETVWPGPVSIILPCHSDDHDYLHRGLNSIAVRMPNSKWLHELIEETGPIIATSANISGEEASKDIHEIKNQFSGLDFYLNGEVNSKPSRILKLDGNKLAYVAR